MRPCSMTTTRRARRIEESRWATTRSVRLPDEFVEGVLYEFFRLAIDGGGGFIENEDGRVHDKRAGERDALPLTA